MADQNRSNGSEDNARGSQPNEGKSANKSDNDSEWLRDQVGEDHNLSGSTTFRTLPDQPEPKKEKRSDADDRQSNR